LLKLVFVLSALLLIPTLSSVTANTSPISIQITDTVNDCLDDANGTSPIETMLVDANGYQQVTTTWSLYEGCTISPVVPDALIDLEARDVVISLWATSAKITLQSGLNLAIGNLIFWIRQIMSYLGALARRNLLITVRSPSLDWLNLMGRITTSLKTLERFTFLVMFI
jgi:hypothetical protein